MSDDAIPYVAQSGEEVELTKLDREILFVEAEKLKQKGLNDEAANLYFKSLKMLTNKTVFPSLPMCLKTLALFYFEKNNYNTALQLISWVNQYYKVALTETEKIQNKIQEFAQFFSDDEKLLDDNSEIAKLTPKSPDISQNDLSHLNNLFTASPEHSNQNSLLDSPPKSDEFLCDLYSKLNTNSLIEPMNEDKDDMTDDIKQDYPRKHYCTNEEILSDLNYRELLFKKIEHEQDIASEQDIKESMVKQIELEQDVVRYDADSINVIKTGQGKDKSFTHNSIFNTDNIGDHPIDQSMELVQDSDLLDQEHTNNKQDEIKCNQMTTSKLMLTFQMMAVVIMFSVLVVTTMMYYWDYSLFVDVPATPPVIPKLAPPPPTLIEVLESKVFMAAQLFFKWLTSHVVGV